METIPLLEVQHEMSPPWILKIEISSLLGADALLFTFPGDSSFPSSER
jgi:hypothetical protein